MKGFRTQSASVSQGWAFFQAAATCTEAISSQHIPLTVLFRTWPHDSVYNCNRGNPEPLQQHLQKCQLLLWASLHGGIATLYSKKGKHHLDSSFYSTQVMALALAKTHLKSAEKLFQSKNSTHDSNINFTVPMEGFVLHLAAICQHLESLCFPFQL